MVPGKYCYESGVTKVVLRKWYYESEEELVLIKRSEIFRRVVCFLRERFEVFIVRHTVPADSAQVEEAMDTIHSRRTQSRAY